MRSPQSMSVVVLLGGAEEAGEDADRELLRDLLDEVELAERERTIEHLGRELTERELVRLDRARRERRSDEPAQARVPRGIGLEHRLADRCSSSRSSRFAPCSECVRVPRDGDDVGVLRHAPVPAAERPVVPQTGGLAAEEREGLVRKALGEDVVRG